MTSPTPLFSVIVPVYKVELYLPACIDSILSQTFTDFEVILVDDGSPDRCGEICDNHAALDARVSVLHKSNGGAAAARNAGTARAKGRYIIFADSDDYWSSATLLADLATRIERHDEDIVLFGCTTLETDGNEYVSRGNYDLALIDRHDKQTTLRYLVKSNKMPGAPWIVATKRAIAKELEFPAGVTAEDFVWIANALYRSRAVGAINNVGYCYRKREGSITTQLNSKGLDGMLLAIDDWLQKSDIEQHPWQTLFMKRVFMQLLMNYARFDRTTRRSYRKAVDRSSGILNHCGQRWLRVAYRLVGPTLAGKAALTAYALLRRIR